MGDNGKQITGGCLCGAVRYEADGPPDYAGCCFCADCRKVSGAGFIPFMGFKASALRFVGATETFAAKSVRGSDAVRNFCPHCHSLVFGGIVGQDTQHTIYAGSLDDAAAFQPKIAIFTRDRADWASLPAGLAAFHTMPGME